MIVQALCMTGSDLCSAAKPWGSQEATAEVIYSEFYEQVTKLRLLTWVRPSVCLLVPSHTQQ